MLARCARGYLLRDQFVLIIKTSSYVELKRMTNNTKKMRDVN